MNNNQGQTNLKPIIVNGIFLIVGGLLGGLFGYLGTKLNADAQIKAAEANAQAQISSAQEAAQAQITSVWIPIQATLTAEARLAQVALSATPYPTLTKTPVFTSTPEYSDAINVVNDFYSFINNAGNKDDLIKSWNLETTGLNGYQCKEAAGCDYPNFRDAWWEKKVQYKLYDCGANLVDVELQEYKRDPLLASTPTTPIFKRFHLVDVKGELKINSDEKIQGPGVECELKISVP